MNWRSLMKHETSGIRLNYKRTVFVGLAFLSICSFWQLYENIIPKMLKYTFGLEDSVTNSIMALDNVLALLLLPLFGRISDKVKTPIGKRTPFIIGGTILAAGSMIFIPYADQKGNLILFVVSLGAVLLAMSFYRSPAVALMPDLTPKPLRSKANAIINLMGAVGGVYALIIMKLFIPTGEHPDYTPVFLFVILLMLISIVVLFITIKENKLVAEVEEVNKQLEAKEKETSATLEGALSYEQEEFAQDIDSEPKLMPKEVKRSLYFILASIFLWFTAYNGVTTAFSRYVTEVWGLTGGGFTNSLMVATVAAIFSYIPIGFISSRVGRKKTILVGIILMTVSYLSGCFLVHYSPVIYVVFALTGIGWAAINVNSYPMVVEMSKGSDVGKYTGIYYTFSMAAQIFTPVFSGFLLQYISYRILFPYALIFSIASLCTMLFVKHGDSIPERRSGLENFDVDD